MTAADGWFKSSDCVGLKQLDDGVAVRHSKNPGGPTLQFTGLEWDAFVAGVKAGEFDD